MCFLSLFDKKRNDRGTIDPFLQHMVNDNGI